MENRVFFGLLMLGEGPLALNYVIFCFVASLGVMQFVAARYGLRGMMLFPRQLSAWMGLTLVVFAYAWFFTVQPDLYIPGLAGGELSTFSVLAFALAVVASLALGYISLRVLNRPRVMPPPRRERVTLSKSARGELWMPSDEFSVLILVLRESAADSVDLLASELVRRGAAVFICDERVTREALDYMRLRFEPLTTIAWAAVGIGTGADQVLAQGVADHPRFRKIMALAPYGTPHNKRAGLRWLRETDYVTAFRLTRRATRTTPVERQDILIVYGDEDTLIPPSLARATFPRAVMVAGAHHFDLAAHPATLALAAEHFRMASRRATALDEPTIPLLEGSTAPNNGGAIKPLTNI